MQLRGENLLIPHHQIQNRCPAFAFNPFASAAIIPPKSQVYPCPPPSPSLPRVDSVFVGIRIVHAEGVAALFSSVSTIVLHQTLYPTTRMGLYDVVKKDGPNPDTGSMPLRCIYNGVIDALTRMSKREGIASLWRGSSLKMNRVMIMTASQLALYDEIEEEILEKGVLRDELRMQVTAGFTAGFVAAVVSNPIDVTKTRVMNIKVEARKATPYNGVIDCSIRQ
ncbi:hypothetical protein GH714_003308 [Hevea brasiliensis]|uniref:ADP,ATP carrier protein n=1 Tax=Hevea brasiliensis TaxID=3981 RepID=A0A6A6LI46_HEVBR|nr:hypothetical protein GH714_003308 [Hevea brasiliensis]